MHCSYWGNICYIQLCIAATPCVFLRRRTLHILNGPHHGVQGNSNDQFERALQELREKAAAGILNLNTAAAASVPLPNGVPAQQEPQQQMPTAFRAASQQQMPTAFGAASQQQMPTAFGAASATPFGAASATPFGAGASQQPKQVTKANRYDLLLGD